MKTILHINGEAVTLENIERSGDSVAFMLEGKKFAFDKSQLQANYSQTKNGTYIQYGGLEATVSEASATAASAGAASLSPLTPMPGVVRKIMVKTGDKVTAGQALAVMEAMKLQITLSAGGAGTVEKVLVKEGELVTEGIELFSLKEK